MTTHHRRALPAVAGRRSPGRGQPPAGHHLGAAPGGPLAASLGLSAVAAGALTTLPVVCMGLFAPVAAVFAHRFGPTPVLGLAVALIGWAGCGRSARSPGSTPGTAWPGSGIAVAGALLPSAGPAPVPDRVGPVTGLYTPR